MYKNNNKLLATGRVEKNHYNSNMANMTIFHMNRNRNEQKKPGGKKSEQIHSISAIEQASRSFTSQKNFRKIYSKMKRYLSQSVVQIQWYENDVGWALMLKYESNQDSNEFFHLFYLFVFCRRQINTIYVARCIERVFLVVHILHILLIIRSFVRSLVRSVWNRECIWGVLCIFSHLNGFITICRKWLWL